MKNKLIDKTLRVLELIASSPEPVALKNISGILKITPGTLSRIISDLCEYGVVEKFGYHRVRPSIGMIRLGQDAMTNFALPRIVPPLIRSHAEAVEANGAFAGMHRSKLVYLYNSRGGHATAAGTLGLPYWEPVLRSRLAAVVLGSGYEIAELREIARDILLSAEGSESREEDVEFFISNCQLVKENGYLSHREFGRGWSVNFPVRCGSKLYAVSLFGQDAEHCNLERMIFETSLLASRLNSALDEKSSFSHSV